MVVIVPDAGTFATFEQSLRADGSIRRIVDGLGDAQVRLRLPKFEFRTQAALKGPLARLGMPIAFSDRADFSGMSPRGKELTIQDVLHEGFISVDEEGTEAAAATAVLVGLTSAPSLNVELTVDRPFLFLIRDDQSGALLFMGRVVDPA
jgi:serpin B